MATWQLYNNTLLEFWKGTFLEAHDFKIMALNDDAVFDGTDASASTVSNAGELEVFGNGWTEGGETLQNVVIEAFDTNGIKFDADDIVVAISSGGFGPYQAFLIYDDTTATDMVMAYLQLDAAAETLADQGCAIFFPEDGIITGTVAVP
jgi:hypothetical protein